MAAATARSRATRERRKQPLEYSLLYTATLCLIAAGAVMVYSASSAGALLNQGDPSYYLKRYVIFAIVGIAVMHSVSRRGLAATRNVTPLLLTAAFVLCVAVMVPGIG